MRYSHATEKYELGGRAQLQSKSGGLSGHIHEKTKIEMLSSAHLAAAQRSRFLPQPKRDSRFLVFVSDWRLTTGSRRLVGKEKGRTMPRTSEPRTLTNSWLILATDTELATALVTSMRQVDCCASSEPVPTCFTHTKRHTAKRYARAHQARQVRRDVSSANKSSSLLISVGGGARGVAKINHSREIRDSFVLQTVHLFTYSRFVMIVKVLKCGENEEATRDLQFLTICARIPLTSSVASHPRFASFSFLVLRVLLEAGSVALETIKVRLVVIFSDSGPNSRNVRGLDF